MAETDEGAERLRVARDLVFSGRLDVSAALTLLNTLPDTLGPSVAEAVGHAKRAVAGAPGRDHRHQAVARYMVARVLVLLEQARAAQGCG